MRMKQVDVSRLTTNVIEEFNSKLNLKLCVWVVFLPTSLNLCRVLKHQRQPETIKTKVFVVVESYLSLSPNFIFIHLNEETKNISVCLGLLNQTSTKVVSSSPLAEFSNVL